MHTQPNAALKVILIQLLVRSSASSSRPFPTVPLLCHTSQCPARDSRHSKAHSLVHLCRQVRAPATVRVVKQHQLPVLLADDLLRRAAFPAHTSPSAIRALRTRPLCLHRRPLSPTRTSQPKQGSSPAPVPAPEAWLGGVLRHFQNERGLLPIHARLEAALVERPAQRVRAAAVAAQGDEARAALHRCQSGRAEEEARRGGRTKKAAAATPKPIASAEAICLRARDSGMRTLRCRAAWVGARRGGWT